MYEPESVLIPESLDEVLSALAEFRESARIVAGNTTMFELASRGLAEDVKVLIDVTKAGLGYVSEKEDGLRIGATVTLTEVIGNPMIAGSPRYSALAEACRSVTPVQVRNVATVGGEVCAAMPFYDLPPALIALGARVVLRSKGSERSVRLQDFITGSFGLALEPGELLTELLLPRSNGTSAAAFRKLGRTAFDLAVVNAAACLGVDSGGKCSSADICLGAVDSNYRVCEEAQDALMDSELDDKAIALAAEKAANFEPSSSIHASGDYKKLVIPVLVRDCLRDARKKLP
jgi:CO/xanthine dehydrogenase FAD-binding subunit